MAASSQATDSLTHLVSAYADRNLLTRARMDLPHLQFGARKTLPSRSSDTIKFRRYAPITADTAAITEGTTPTMKTLSYTDYTGTLATYGAWIGLTDEAVGEGWEDHIANALDVLGQHAVETLDGIVKGVLDGGTGVTFADADAGGNASTASVGASDIPTLTDLRNIVKTLKSNKAKKLTPMAAATNQVATTGIPSSYVAVIHANATNSFKSISGWQDVQNYNNNTFAFEGEIGRIEELRFIESQAANILSGSGAGGIDVYTAILLGQEAYGLVNLAGVDAEGQSTAIQSIIKPFGANGNDPLNQQASVGWKAKFAALILNQNWMRRYEFAL